MKKFFSELWLKIVKYTPFVLKKVCIWYLTKLGYEVKEKK